MIGHRMKPPPPLSCLLCALFLATPSPAQPEPDSAPSLTLYNQAFAVVREQIPLTLEAGENQLTFDAITAHLEPSSIILRDPAGKIDLQILEQNYQNDPLSQGLLLQKFEGKTIEFLTFLDGKPVVVQGKIIRAPYVMHQQAMQRLGAQYAQRQMAWGGQFGGNLNSPIIEVEGKLRFSLPGEPLFPDSGESTNLKPTLSWTLNASKGGQGTFELSYISGGFLWEADYNLILPEKGDLATLIGWVTMENQSGRTFENASIKLMAGDVSKIQDAVVGMLQARTAVGSSRRAEEPVMGQKAFDEYHLYTLNRPSTLRDRETKQVEFVRASNVTTERHFIYNGAGIDWQQYRGRNSESIRDDRSFGTQSNDKVWVYRFIKNTKENNLGIPLPKGRVRFYRQDTGDALEFVGENEIDHTPQGEEIRVHTGDAFDIVGKRRQTDFQIDVSRRWLQESFEIEIRNRKPEPVEVTVVEDLYRWHNWKLTAQSDPHLKKDSRQIEFLVQVKPDETRTITYTVDYTW